jgi:hypothetical protein
VKLSRPTRVGAILVGALVLAVGPALSAAGDDTSTTTFAASATQTVSYGTNWLIPITVAGSASYDFVTATSGTVNILIKGIPGNYATGLPLTPGGQAFFSPPSSAPPLGAGTYEVTAVYVPSGTAYLSPSQTLTPATLTITALSLTSSFAVDRITVNNKPGLQVVASVSPSKADVAIPNGKWRITATDSTGARAFSATVPLAKNPADPVTVTLGKAVKPGHKYTISAKFVPAALIADGYQVKNADPKVVTVEAESFGEILSTPYDASIWVLGAIGLGLALLIAAAIVLLVRRVPKPESAEGGEPGDSAATQSEPTAAP